MFGITALKKQIEAMNDEIVALKLEQVKINATAQQDEMALRKEIGRAIEALINGADDAERTWFYTRFERLSDFMGTFKCFIKKEVSDGVSKDMKTEFDARLDEAFIDEVVSRINRKQVG